MACVLPAATRFCKFIWKLITAVVKTLKLLFSTLGSCHDMRWPQHQEDLSGNHQGWDVSLLMDLKDLYSSIACDLDRIYSQLSSMVYKIYCIYGRVLHVPGPPPMVWSPPIPGTPQYYHYYYYYGWWLKSCTACHVMHDSIFDASPCNPHNFKVGLTSKVVQDFSQSGLLTFPGLE